MDFAIRCECQCRRLVADSNEGFEYLDRVVKNYTKIVVKMLSVFNFKKNILFPSN